MSITPGRSKPSRLILGNHHKVKGWNRTVKLTKKFALKRQHSSYPTLVAGFSFRAPMWYRSFKRHGVRNLNDAEHKYYVQYFSTVPSHLKGNFAHIRRVVRIRGGSVLVMEAVNDFDGRPSRSLGEMESFQDARFWKRMDGVVDWLIQRQIPFFDFSPWNFVVKRINNTDCVPVLIDYKSASTRIFPLRPWLAWSPTRRAVEMRKRYAHLKSKCGFKET